MNSPKSETCSTTNTIYNPVAYITQSVQKIYIRRDFFTHKFTKPTPHLRWQSLILSDFSQTQLNMWVLIQCDRSKHSTRCSPTSCKEQMTTSVHLPSQRPMLSRFMHGLGPARRRENDGSPLRSSVAAVYCYLYTPNRQGAQRAAAAVPCVNTSTLMIITALQPRLRVTLFSHGADRNGSTTPSFRARGSKKAQRTAHTRTHTERGNMLNLHKWASYDTQSHGQRTGGVKIPQMQSVQGTKTCFVTYRTRCPASLFPENQADQFQTDGYSWD